jgi:hypothetical protein
MAGHSHLKVCATNYTNKHELQLFFITRIWICTLLNLEQTYEVKKKLIGLKGF